MTNLYYLKVYLKGLRTYEYYNKLSLDQAQFKQLEHKRKGRAAEIFPHKKNG